MGNLFLHKYLSSQLVRLGARLKHTCFKILLWILRWQKQNIKLSVSSFPAHCINRTLTTPALRLDSYTFLSLAVLILHFLSGMHSVPSTGVNSHCTKRKQKLCPYLVALTVNTVLWSSISLCALFLPVLLVGNQCAFMRIEEKPA